MGWIDLPMADEPLESVRHLGNGKDAELVLVFAGGRRVVLPVSTARVEAGNGITVEVSSADDVSLRIDYVGPDLRLHSGRFGFDDSDDFVEEGRSWVAGGCEAELFYVVDVEICLTGSS